MVIDLKRIRDHVKWGRDWKPDIAPNGNWTGHVAFDDEDSFEFSPDEDHCVELIEYVCAMHNVMPKLLARIEELESAGRCAAVALRMHDPFSPTAVHTYEILAKGIA